jgi:poly-gamma-glutamate capsule biosynthesis protein CapA/YwtB (metallophosphatase superfamily)
MHRAGWLLILAACSGGAGTSPDAAGGDDDDAPPADATPASPDAGPEDVAEIDAAEGGWTIASEPDDDVPADEVAARATLTATPIEVVGRVTTGAVGVEGALVRIGDASVTTGPSGRFRVFGLNRRNRLVHVELAGHYTVELAAHLLRPVAETRVDLGDVPLSSTTATVRFLFGGDTSFARRFMDPDDSTPRDQVPPSDPTALIDSANPAPGAAALFDFVRPYFQAVDFPVVNLESVVTDTPAEPHPTKDYVYFSLPGAVGALATLGVQYVSLGNNHVYDYLEGGVVDTRASLDAAGIAHSGLGASPDEAFVAHTTTLGGHAYSFLSMSSISGVEHPPIYVAAEPPDVAETKGGSADLRETARVTAAVESAVANGEVAIAQLHTGEEYTFEPSSYARGRMQLVADAGASLVIAHHPHVAQGFAWVGDALVAHSLGNFCFDQDRIETMLGVLAVADLDGGIVRRAQALPVYLEDYRPRPVTGRLASQLLRRIGERSDLTLAIAHGRGLITRDAITVDTRDVDVTVTVDASGLAILDLRRVAADGESLARAATDVAATADPGEDLLVHGDLEDYDVDLEHLEASRWDTTAASTFVCVHAPASGAAALCSARHSTNTATSVIALRNRVRLAGLAIGTPNKDISLFGYVRGDNAGSIAIVTRYYASEGATEFGEETPFTLVAGTYDWTPFFAALNVPADVVDPTTPASETDNPGALRVFLRQAPPASGDAVARYDDLAIIDWRSGGSLVGGLDLAAPNPIDFLRIAATPGTYTVHLRFERARVAQPSL